MLGPGEGSHLLEYTTHNTLHVLLWVTLKILDWKVFVGVFIFLKVTHSYLKSVCTSGILVTLGLSWCDLVLWDHNHFYRTNIGLTGTSVATHVLLDMLSWGLHWAVLLCLQKFVLCLNKNPIGRRHIRGCEVCSLNPALLCFFYFFTS